MAKQQHAPKFRRASPSVRREALIEATLASLRKHGHEGASARRIATEAGVSAGLITHHFPSMSALIAAAYEALAMSLLNSIRKHSREVGATPRERLRRFFEASFTPTLLEPGLFNAWLVFWSMIAHDEEVRAVQDRTWLAYRAALESLLGQLRAAESVPAFRLRPAGFALSALLDGLWIEASLNPRAFKPAEAVAMCEDWIHALCSGAFPSLLASRSGRVAG
ncbi:MAG TPA: TetR family transcriptional regulator C-terminal domain-containing protein [Steroidobacteraceae bacterium]|nr:TetR family transcriptional regulator C-terminal domain-containing protein [Steroidobacteraceae bacterium]